MTFYQSFFSSYTSISSISIGVANGNTFSAVGVGSVYVSVSVFGTHSVCVFENVLHVSGLAHSLFSTSTVSSKGYTTIFKGDHVFINDSMGELVAVGHKVGGLFCLDVEVILPEVYVAFSEHAMLASSVSLQLLHECLSHINQFHQ